MIEARIEQLKPLNMFDLGVEDTHYSYKKQFKQGQTVRLFESFAGIGCQRMALNKLGIPYESVGISEIDKYALMSYKAIHGDCLNYGDITKMAEIPECEIFTWSFPCTDLSKAGQQKGLQGGTRSGFVYEVIRLLKATEIKPKVLIMENVPDLVGAKFIGEFTLIRQELEEMGYKNFWSVLNAKDYGVPQNRERVFMVSVLDNSAQYSFPVEQLLKTRLKDVLEENVGEKYYLSEKQIEQMRTPKFESMGIDRVKKPTDEIINCITCMGGGNREPKIIDTTICLNSKVDGKQPSLQDRVYDTSGLSTAITTSFMPSIIEIGNYSPSGHNASRIVDIDGLAPAVMENHGTVTGVVVKDIIVYDDFNSKIRDDQKTIGTLTTNIGSSTPRHGYKIIETNLRVRKLTPKECWRLMGIADSDFEKAAKAVTNSQLYKQAGNGIVVNVFAEILKGLFDTESEVLNDGQETSVAVRDQADQPNILVQVETLVYQNPQAVELLFEIEKIIENCAIVPKKNIEKFSTEEITPCPDNGRWSNENYLQVEKTFSVKVLVKCEKGRMLRREDWYIKQTKERCIEEITALLEEKAVEEVDGFNHFKC